MTEKLASPPDRLSLDPRSKFFDSDQLERGIGVRFKDKERTSVIEYCISESWIRIQAGTSNDRRGNPMTVKLNGPVEVWFEDAAAEGESAEAQAPDDSAEAEHSGEAPPADSE